MWNLKSKQPKKPPRWFLRATGLHKWIKWGEKSPDLCLPDTLDYKAIAEDPTAGMNTSVFSSHLSQYPSCPSLGLIAKSNRLDKQDFGVMHYAGMCEKVNCCASQTHLLLKTHNVFYS